MCAFQETKEKNNCKVNHGMVQTEATFLWLALNSLQILSLFSQKNHPKLK